MALSSCMSLISLFPCMHQLPWVLTVWAKYDMSGVWPDKIQKILERGWIRLAG